jgi:hypothetical protein
MHFKYVTKGPKCSKAYLQKIRNREDTPIDEETNTRNEVQEYLDTQYICSFDSCWRVFGFEIHQHFLAVERMPVHLPDENYYLKNSFIKQCRLNGLWQIRNIQMLEVFVIVISPQNGVGMNKQEHGKKDVGTTVK